MANQVMDVQAENSQSYQNPAIREEDTTPIKFGGFLGMMLLSFVPVVNVIMFFVWGFGNHNVNKRNYGRAALIVLVIVSIVAAIAYGAIVSAIESYVTDYVMNTLMS
jgi:hypothetical protein